MLRAAFRSILLFLGVVFIAEGVASPEYMALLVLSGCCLLGLYAGTAE